MTEYTFSSSGVINGSADDIIRWLATPELMAAWIPHARSVRAIDGLGIAVGAKIRLEISGYRYPTTYLGEITDLTRIRLVRRYTLPALTAQLQRAAAGRPPDYERIAVYELTPAAAGIALGCTVTISIPGLAKSIAKKATKSEGNSLHQALDRLKNCVEGRPPAPVRSPPFGHIVGQAL